MATEVPKGNLIVQRHDGVENEGHGRRPDNGGQVVVRGRRVDDGQPKVRPGHTTARACANPGYRPVRFLANTDSCATAPSVRVCNDSCCQHVDRHGGERAIQSHAFEGGSSTVAYAMPMVVPTRRARSRHRPGRTATGGARSARPPRHPHPPARAPAERWRPRRAPTHPPCPATPQAGQRRGGRLAEQGAESFLEDAGRHSCRVQRRGPAHRRPARMPTRAARHRRRGHPPAGVRSTARVAPGVHGDCWQQQYSEECARRRARRPTPHAHARPAPTRSS